MNATMFPPGTYLATRFERDGEYGERLSAPSETAAERICDERGWRFDGLAYCQVTGIDATQADALIAALGERDGAVVH